MRIRRGPAALALAAVIAAAAGCGTATSTSPAAPSSPTLLTSGPGTPIGDGFVVAPDSRLVGVPFPQNAHGWVAVLSIDANPLRVVDSYLTQATAHGLQPTLQCFADYPSGRNRTQDVLDDSHPPRPGAQAVTCEVLTDNSKGGAFWRLFVHWGTLYDRSVSFTAAVMEFTPGTRASGAVPAVHAPRRMPAMIAWKRPATASVGQRFDGDFSGLNSGKQAGLRVAPGSQLAAPVADNGCTTGGFAAVLKLDNDAVADQYANQLGDNNFPPGPPTAISGGRGAVERTGQVAGGGDVSLTQLQRDGKEWLLIQRCND